MNAADSQQPQERNEASESSTESSVRDSTNMDSNTRIPTYAEKTMGQGFPVVKAPDPPQETTTMILSMMKEIQMEMREIRKERNQWNQYWYQYQPNQQC